MDSSALARKLGIKLGKVLLKDAPADFAAASSDLSVAEETHRRAIAHLPQAKQTFSRYLAAILNQHAALLDHLGKSADAAKLRAEEASL